VALLNAGAALAAEAGVAGPGELVASLAEGYRRAAAAVDSGAAASLLDRWVQVSKRLASE
jgi:anthranilate phosphoribosyltransferase